jgi:transposase
LFAQSLARDDRVALEVTGNAWEIARILEAHVARVIVVSPSDTGIRQARAKTDRLDALALARLLAAGSLDAVWTPDEPVRVMRRRLARRSQLITSRSRVKNEVHAVLVRRLKGRPPCSDLFGLKGRAWLAELELPVEERETVDAGLRQIDLLDSEVAEVDRVIALHALQWPEIGRLMTVPGVNVTVAATFLAAVGDIRRFPRRPSSSATWAWTRAFASPVTRPPSTGASPSRARRPAGTRSWRPPGAPSDHRARYAPSTSASARGAGIRSRSSPRPASWPACSGVC